MAENAIQWHGSDLHLNIKATPKASKTEFSEIRDGRIVIRVMAPPIEGKANKALIDFLSKQFKVAKSRIQLVRGDNSRLKTICIPDPIKIPEFIQEKQHA